ncbi:MAG: hypothetical protein K2H18_04570 [Muribaculaceae bacterium]|nr:hypothetical protein [Muribaculaceae bacterium]
MKAKSLISIAAIASFLMMMSCSNSDKKTTDTIYVVEEQPIEENYNQYPEYGNYDYGSDVGTVAPTDGIPDDELDEYENEFIRAEAEHDSYDY